MPRDVHDRKGAFRTCSGREAELIRTRDAEGGVVEGTHEPNQSQQDWRVAQQKGATMLGYCGINCTECAAYKATVTSDEKLMQHVQEKFGDGTGRREDWVCLGCLCTEPVLVARYCTSCKIRSCAVTRGVANCAVCPDYDGCGKVHPFIQGEDAAVVRRMRWLRDAFLKRS